MMIMGMQYRIKIKQMLMFLLTEINIYSPDLVWELLGSNADHYHQLGNLAVLYFISSFNILNAGRLLQSSTATFRFAIELIAVFNPLQSSDI